MKIEYLFFARMMYFVLGIPVSYIYLYQFYVSFMYICTAVLHTKTWYTPMLLYLVNTKYDTIGHGSFAYITGTHTI